MPLADILSDTQRKRFNPIIIYQLLLIYFFSMIGRAFEHIAEEAKIDVKREYFDSSSMFHFEIIYQVKLKKEFFLLKFFEYLLFVYILLLYF